jgi:flagellar basal-body rod modification protein FlgD
MAMAKSATTHERKYMLNAVNANAAMTAANPLSGQPTTKDVQDIFLKIFSTELAHQNPLSPMDNKEWVQQFVQFSSYNQMATLNKQLESLKQMVGFLQAASLVGKQITYSDEVNATQQGIVSGVSQKNGELFVDVGDKKIPFTSISQVKEQKGVQV